MTVAGEVEVRDVAGGEGLAFGFEVELIQPSSCLRGEGGVGREGGWRL